MPVKNTIHVNLKERSYDVFVGKNMLSFVSEWVRRLYSEKEVFLIADKVVFDLYGEEIKRFGEGISLQVLPLVLGEERKKIESAEEIFDFLMENRCDRSSLIVGLGGGVTGDITGFCASLFMRGIDYIQVPTTLLAQVDSSVGGKTAVNYKDGKNVIGTFYQPKAVFADIGFLSTLDERNFRSGMAEVIKSGFMGDREIVEMMRNRSLSDIRSQEAVLIDLIVRSIQFKERIVSRDENELGERRVLNFGHTLGHCLEEATEYMSLLHGEAIACGMALEGQISLTLGVCTEETRNILVGLLDDSSFDILPESVDYSKVISLLVRDKKRLANSIVLPLIKDVGAYEMREIGLQEYERLVADSLKYLKALKEVKLKSSLKMGFIEDLRALESTGRLNDAENLVKKYLEEDPTNEQLNLTLARLYKKQGKTTNSLKVLDEIIRANPQYQEAILMRKDVAEDLVLTSTEEGEEAEYPPVEKVFSFEDELYEIQGAGEEGIEDEGLEIREPEIRSTGPVEEEETGEIQVYTIPMAEVLMKEGKIEKALDVIREILAREPENIKAEELKGVMEEKHRKIKFLKSYEEKIKAFLQKIEEEYR